jgi:hypothetical protein
MYASKDVVYKWTEREPTTYWAMLATYFTVVSCLAYSSTLKMEVTCYSEESVDFQVTTQRYIPENRNIRKYVLISFTRRHDKIITRSPENKAKFRYLRTT